MTVTILLHLVNRNTPKLTLINFMTSVFCDKVIYKPICLT